MDTHEYFVTFDDGDMTELNANLIAQSMYVKCDSDSSQYVLSLLVVDIKMEDFKCKARLVTGGHKTNAPVTTQC